jgi:hypothetical protein
VSFLCRIAIRWINARGIWYPVAGRQRLQRHSQLPRLVSAVVLPIKSSRLTCTRSSCVRNARKVAGAKRPLPNKSRKSVLIVTELRQSLRNGHANEREPSRSRSQQSKIELLSRTASARPSSQANPMSEVSDYLAGAALARARSLHATRKAFISARRTAIRAATPLYFFVAPVISRWTAP